MIQIAIIDDEKEACASLERMVEEALLSHHFKAQIHTFCDSVQFVQNYEGGFDLIFIDIQMPNMDGMRAAEIIRAKDADVLLIFVTSMMQFAVQGYKVEAMDYIVKPVVPALLEHSLARALKKLDNRSPKHISIRSLNGLRNIDINEIVYAEMANRHLTLYTRTEAFACVQTMNQLENELKNHGFFRCHSAFLVNIKCVKGIRGNDIDIAGRVIPMSKHRRKEFMKELTACWGMNI